MQQAFGVKGGGMGGKACEVSGTALLGEPAGTWASGLHFIVSVGVPVLLTHLLSEKS